MIRLIIIVISLLILNTSSNYTQSLNDKDTDTKITAMEGFHDILHPMWHDAYPAKDYKALRSYMYEINTKAEKIYKVKLPGILQDKKERWNKGVAEFKHAVREYTKYAAAHNDKELLKAAEVLHSKYEELVRIIKPVLKEAGAFHKILYIIYNEYLPRKDYAAIQPLCKELQAKAEAITKAKLPAAYKAKRNEFLNTADNLYDMVKKLNENYSLYKGDEIELSIEKIHTQYQKLEELFNKKN